MFKETENIQITLQTDFKLIPFILLWKITVPQLLKAFPSFTEPKGSLLCSQEPAK
jgi:hypothetical protein